MPVVGSPPTLNTARLTGSLEGRDVTIRVNRTEGPGTYTATLDEIMASSGPIKGTGKNADNQKMPPGRGTSSGEEEETGNSKQAKPRSFFRRLFGRR